MVNNTKSKKGFTIIEVVLVLAIAGLIFLMVFIALPALQRSQRNTQRRDDYSMLSTAVTNYISNNGGRLSRITSISDELPATTWINSDGTDPNGNPYHITVKTISDLGDSTPGEDEEDNGSEVFIVVSANCNGQNAKGEAVPIADKGTNAFAIYGYMEGSAAYCQASGSVGDKE